MRTLTRRKFLSTAAAVAGSVTIAPSYCLGRTAARAAPSDTLTFAKVGCGGMGGGDYNSVVGSGAKPSALCDIDAQRAAGVVKHDAAKSLKLYGAGQDLLSDAFSGNVKGMGPGVAEIEIEERKSEPIIVFMADKTSAGAWNMPLYKMFADPFNTIGLVAGDRA